MGLYLVAYGADCFGSPVRADGVGYFIYLPAYIVHGDPSLASVVGGTFEGEIPGWTGVYLVPGRGCYANQFNAGVALMMAPFYILGHILTTLLRGVGWNDSNGYSLVHQHAVGFAGVFYFVVGVELLRRALASHFPARVVGLTLVSLILGTNLLHYGTGENVMSHVYTFFLVTLLIHATARWEQHPDQVGRAVVLGLVMGLIPLVRTPNIILLGVFLAHGVTSLSTAAGRLALFARHRRSLLLAAGIALLVLLPQLLIWNYTFGRPWVNSYAVLYPELDLTHFESPRILDTLVSLRGGVLFWAPVLAFSLFGIPWLRLRCPGVFLPALLVPLAMFYLIASWHDWAFGGGFGHRGFVDILPLLAFPMAAFYERAMGSGSRRTTLLLHGAVAIMVAFEWVLLRMYYTRELSYYGLDGDALFDIIFWWYKSIGGLVAAAAGA